MLAHSYRDERSSKWKNIVSKLIKILARKHAAHMLQVTTTKYDGGVAARDSRSHPPPSIRGSSQLTLFSFSVRLQKWPTFDVSMEGSSPLEYGSRELFG